MSQTNIPDDIKVHGVYERTVNKDWMDPHIEELQRDGFTVVRGALNSEQLNQTREGLDYLYDFQLKEFGEENLAAIKDKYIVRSMLAYDDFFLDHIALNSKVLPIIKKVLGTNISLSSQVGIMSPPNDILYQTAWHRELQYQHFTSSRPIALQTLICVDPFNATTGGTFFLPGSHLHEPFPSNEYIRKNEIQIIADPGDVVVFNALTYHRAGVNCSQSVRRAINNLYTLPIIQQQINISRMLNGKHKDDPFLAGLLGYRWETADSVLAWRNAHLKK
ncbi:phytanoyl-CoA dioxygenase family protein [Duganella sp. FT92W]|uniref:Phytanoyl-CoA dioxygenase family protein n=1 Tax=Pseudoduganella rivuli TaxID=2666085 RepID=A0A7X2LSX6_9BURK|nr:phytanoyl-CoA dioxygenase family protein [Pseudoduganella rivuli]MRV71402.1 phytanoyl-CoA dioxygenase family protein [Pseudoduganella rivuli]